MLIGKEIKRRRKELKISVADLAQSVGVSPAAIYQWEAGDTKNIRPDNLLAAARALKTTMEALMTGENTSGLSPEAEALAREWLDLTPELREVVRANLNDCKAILKKFPQLRTQADSERVKQFLKPVKGKA